jgi:hypothetical protein
VSKDKKFEITPKVREELDALVRKAAKEKRAEAKMAREQEKAAKSKKAEAK